MEGRTVRREEASDTLARLWQAPAVDVLPLAATANSWSWTWDHSWGGQKSSSFEPAPPKHGTDEASIDAAPVAREKASDTLGRLWQAPVLNVLPVAATAHTFGIKWDLYLGGGKMEGSALRPPAQPQATSFAPGEAVGKASPKAGHRLWEAPVVSTFSVRSTAR
jgi:hypothetical protein